MPPKSSDKPVNRNTEKSRKRRARLKEEEEEEARKAQKRIYNARHREKKKAAEATKNNNESHRQRQSHLDTIHEESTEAGKKNMFGFGSAPETPKKEQSLMDLHKESVAAVLESGKKKGTFSEDETALLLANADLVAENLKNEGEALKNEGEALKNEGKLLVLKTQEESTKTELAAAKKEEAAKEAQEAAKATQDAAKATQEATAMKEKAEASKWEQKKECSNAFAANGHDMSDDLDTKPAAKRLFAGSPSSKKASASAATPSTPANKSTGGPKEPPVRRSVRKKSKRDLFSP